MGHHSYTDCTRGKAELYNTPSCIYLGIDILSSKLNKKKNGSDRRKKEIRLVLRVKEWENLALEMTVIQRAYVVVSQS